MVLQKACTTQYLEENQWETLSLQRSCRTPLALSCQPPPAHTSAAPSGETNLKSISKRSKLQTPRNQIVDFSLVIYVQHQTLGSTFVLKYILLWWWQDLRFSNYSIQRTKDNHSVILRVYDSIGKEDTSSHLPPTDTRSIPNHMIQSRTTMSSSYSPAVSFTKMNAKHP